MVEPRPPVSTVQFIDSYCELYQNLFPEVRSFENFKYIHLGMISNLKRKSLPEIAKQVGLDNEQSLHHFLTKSPWEAQELRKRRLEIKESDKYKSKPEIAGEMIEELQAFGFKFELVLADSLYGESDVNFVSILHKFNLNYLLATVANSSSGKLRQILIPYPIIQLGM
jgi:SRSO17 transposase